jgi:chromosome segregation ATPase
MNRAESPTQIGAKTSSQIWVFEMVLLAFGTGGATYADVLARLRRLLATGTSPTELLEILRRRQLIEPLPESAQGVLDLLNDAIRRDAAEAVVSAEVQDADPQAVTPHEEVMEERIARQHADYEALTRSYERTREPESAAAARATALAADLAAAQAAVAAEQRRTRDLNLALAEKNAVAEASRTRVDEILRDYERQKSETHTLRDSLAARDTTIVQMRHSLDERDTQLAALQQEHAKVVSTHEARAETGAQLEADLQAALARADAISLELKVGQEAAAVLNAQLKRSESRLNAALTELGAVKTQSSSYLELLRTREWRRGFDHNMIRELDAQVGAASAGHHALESERDRLQGQLAAADSERARLTAELATRDRALLQAQERATSDAQRVAEPKKAADLRQAEQATQIAQLRAKQAAQIERLQADADQREEEMGVLMAHLQEARRPVQAFEADLKRLTEELAAKDAAAAVFDEENRKLSAILEWTRGALEESEFIIRRLERSESNNANVLGRIQTSIERLKSVPGGPAAAGADPGAAASGAADRSAELIRIDGERTTTYMLAKRTRIGRAAGCELQIDSNSVSRHHALVTVGPRDTIIEDLNSTNGVLVNGRSVTRHVLSDGDALTIGETRFRYFARLHDGPPGPNPADCIAPRHLIP